jgi:uncharacterized membrane protein HdeD (DUF308 family)
MARADDFGEDAMSRDIAGMRVPRAVPWWMVLLQGIAGVIIGLLLVTEPGITVLTLVVFLGVYWLITGVIDIVSIFLDRTNWGWRLFTGVLGIIAGLVIVRNPLWAGIAVPTTLVWLLGIIGLVIGGANLVRAFTGAGWGAAIMGVISIVLGILLLTRPLFSLTFLVYLIGFWAIFGGVAAIIGSFYLRSNPRAAGLTPAGWIL